MTEDNLWWREAERFRNSAVLKPMAIVVTTSLPLDNKAGEVILRKFLSLLGTAYRDIWVITSSGSDQITDAPGWIHFRDTLSSGRKHPGLLRRIFKNFSSQFDLCKELNAFKLDGTSVFFWNAGTLVIPHLLARFGHAVTIYFRFGDCSVAPKIKYPGIKGLLLSAVVRFLEDSNLWLAAYVAVEDISMLKTNCRINKYSYKMLQISLFVDLTRFNNTLSIIDRGNDVVYLGRLAPEKGTLKFISSLGKLKLFRSNITVAIIGNGPLKDIVKNSVRNLGSVSFHDWLPYSQVPSSLQKSKILIVPSDTEGLPNVILEGMACGTVPVATAVGGIPGVVSPGNTGFLLENNTPEVIAEGIEKALQHPDLQQISERASEFAHKNYSFDAAAERLQKSLQKAGCI